MHVVKLFFVLAFGVNVEVVKARLPEASRSRARRKWKLGLILNSLFLFPLNLLTTHNFRSCIIDGGVP